MVLKANPNRMELLRLRKRLALARRGHKLLQDKLEEMMRRFLLLLRNVDQAKKEFSERTRNVSDDLLYCRLTSSRDDFQRSLDGIDSRIVPAISFTRIMNVRVPVLEITEVKIEKHYDFYQTSAQLDLVVAGAGEYVRSLLRLAQLLKSLEILSAEIERTRRRVNALQYMLIPSIEETIRYITQKLNELERGNLVRLMRVKEIVRSH
jgi:V/A-type H+/Na+-transporting ATPase subunit D